MQNTAQVVHRAIVARHCAEISLGDDAIHVFLRFRFNPDREAVRAEKIIRFGFVHDTAADGEDRAVVFVGDALECAAFDGAIAGLSVERKDIGERHAGFFFDFAVELDERNVASLGELLAERRLAGAAKTDQSDAFGARRNFRGIGVLLSEELRERCVEGGRDAIEKNDGNVAFAGFQLGEMALGYVGKRREIFSREGSRLAQGANALGQVAQQQRVGWRRSRRKNRAGIMSGGHVIRHDNADSCWMSTGIMR